MRRLLLLIIVVCVVAAAAVAAWTYSDLHKPVNHSKSGQYIEIPKGSSPTAIIRRLVAEGVVKHEWPLKLYLKTTGIGSTLKAGEYEFPSPITPLAVLSKLQQGQRRLNRLTIIEGWTRWDIAAQLARIPELKLHSADEALTLFDDTSMIRDLDPDARNLEGYLYPDTYSFPPDATPKTVVETLVRRFRQVWGELAANNPALAGRSPKEFVTVASLVETEAKLPEERPLVASVIYNRLNRGIPLGIDSTVIYASKLAGRWRNDGKVYLSDVERDSPYNTRRVRGLPPGPVASPGLRSLQAAINPAQTDYLYYVRDPSRNDGAHNFYNNESDFQRGVQALRDWERSRNSNASATPTPSEGTLPQPQPSP